MFQQIYDREHVPALLQVPGVRSVRRYQRNKTLTISLGGKVWEIKHEQEPQYTALYELSNPDVLISDEWNRAVELGRWSTDVRPHTSNRRHTLHKLIS